MQWLIPISMLFTISVKVKESKTRRQTDSQQASSHLERCCSPRPDWSRLEKWLLVAESVRTCIWCLSEVSVSNSDMEREEGVQGFLAKAGGKKFQEVGRSWILFFLPASSFLRENKGAPMILPAALTVCCSRSCPALWQLLNSSCGRLCFLTYHRKYFLCLASLRIKLMLDSRFRSWEMMDFRKMKVCVADKRLLDMTGSAD